MSTGLDDIGRFALQGDKAARRALLRKASRSKDPEVVARLVNLLALVDRPSSIRRVKKAQAERHLMPFCVQAWHVVEPATPFVDNWHLQVMAEHLEAVSSGEIKNLLINMPPRYMKSLMVAVFWLAWEWTRKPYTRWIFGSYSGDLSTRDSIKTRRVLESPWYQDNWGEGVSLVKSGEEQIPFVKMTKDSNRITLFENTASGSRLATGIRGQGTGRGGDRVICDDPHKVTDGGSPKKLDRAAEWWFEEMPSRANSSTGAFVTVMQRIHTKDLSGRILSRAKGDLVWLKLPARYEPQTITYSPEGKREGAESAPKPKHNVIVRFEDPRTVEGELLWKGRFDEKATTELETKLGSAASAGQLQQRPTARGGAIWFRSWWRFWDKASLPVFEFRALSVDVTFGSVKDSASYVVMQHWGFCGADSYLLDQFRKRMKYPEMRIKLAVFAGSHVYDVCWLENKASGLQLSDDLISIVAGIILTEPAKYGNKMMRAIRAAPRIESGNTYLPRPELFPFVEELLDETELFPNAANDDQVDTISQALVMRSEMGDDELDFDFL